MSTSTLSNSDTNSDINSVATNSISNSDPISKPPPLKVLFLSSDTGGGHRASATALGVQFQRLYPNSTYHLLDITKEISRAPYNNLESWYSHLSSNPNQWNLVYKVSNNKVFESVFKIHFKMSVAESKIRQCIQEYEADVVISVHPLMNDIPSQSCMKIGNETNRHLPFFTVVTDLGSGHCTWFEKDVEKMFIASNAIETLARERGGVPKDKLVMSGLPIRYEFAFEAERLGDRTLMEGKIYQLQMRGYLNLFDQTFDMDFKDKGLYNNNKNHNDHDRKVLLVMGGGEGVGSLSDIVNKLYIQCSLNNIQAMILVVCGRNTVLKESLETCDWDLILEDEIIALQQQSQDQDPYSTSVIATSTDEKDSFHTQRVQPQHPHKEQRKQGIASRVTGMVLNPLRALASSRLSPLSPKRKNSPNKNEIISVTLSEEKKDEEFVPPTRATRTSSTSSSSSTSSTASVPHHPTPPSVIVKPLGFISNMAEYMVAADLLITKAGPGTIAEASSLGLPVVLTSFLPGQEEGNVDFVVEKQFGLFQSDSNPNKVAHTVCELLRNPDRMTEMSLHARKSGMPNAAEDIVKCIGKSVIRWKELYDDEDVINEEVI